MKYVKGLLSKHRMEESKTSSYPLLPHAKLSKHDDKPKFESSTKYRQLIGSLWHLTHTRPDISHAVGTLGQFSSAPHVSHWKQCLRVLEYTAIIGDYGITILMTLLYVQRALMIVNQSLDMALFSAMDLFLG